MGGKKKKVASIAPNKVVKCDDGDEKKKEKFLKYFRESGIPPPERWPEQSPIYIAASKRARDVRYELEGGAAVPAPPLPLDGQPIEFDGPSFEGKIVSRMRDVPRGEAADGGASGDRVTSSDYFKGRSRQYQWAVQGRFKKKLRFDQLVTGQDFERPFRHPPAASLVKRGLELLKSKLPDSFECDLFADEPRFEHPLIAGCQFFRVDPASALHSLKGDKLLGEGERGEIVEDTSLLNDPSVPRDSEGRRKYFAKTENLRRYHFEPGLVYTFDFYANFFSPARHRLEITPFMSFDLIPYFNGYPLFMAMAKEKDSDEYLWATEMWHKRLLDYEEKPGKIARLFSPRGGSKKKKKSESDDGEGEGDRWEEDVSDDA